MAVNSRVEGQRKNRKIQKTFIAVVFTRHSCTTMSKYQRYEKSLTMAVIKTVGARSSNATRSLFMIANVYFVAYAHALPVKITFERHKGY